jgi:hypothetical protein
MFKNRIHECDNNNNIFIQDKLLTFSSCEVDTWAQYYVKVLYL